MNEQASNRYGQYVELLRDPSLIKAVSSKDEFDYQVYVEESNRLGINITRARLANQLENFRTEGSRNLVEKLFDKK